MQRRTHELLLENTRRQRTLLVGRISYLLLRLSKFTFDAFDVSRQAAQQVEEFFLHSWGPYGITARLFVLRNEHHLVINEIKLQYLIAFLLIYTSLD